MIRTEISSKWGRQCRMADSNLAPGNYTASNICTYEAEGNDPELILCKKR